MYKCQADPAFEEEEEEGFAELGVAQKKTMDPQPKPVKHRLRHSQPQAVPELSAVSSAVARPELQA